MCLSNFLKSKKLLGFSLLVTTFAFQACQPPSKISRAEFDQAEIAYKTGQYDKATKLYNAFLKSSPDPQLARLAERRVLSIEYEIESIMGRKNGPRPIYTYNDDDSTMPTKLTHFFALHEQKQAP